MKVKAKITLLCDTETGVSKATGNPWSCRELVVEIAEDDGKSSSMALKAFKEEVITTLDNCTKGDVIEAEVRINSQYREYKRVDGTTFVTRYNEAYLHDVKVISQAGF